MLKENSKSLMENFLANSVFSQHPALGENVVLLFQTKDVKTTYANLVIAFATSDGESDVADTWNEYIYSCKQIDDSGAFDTDYASMTLHQDPRGVLFIQIDLDSMGEFVGVFASQADLEKSGWY